MQRIMGEIDIGKTLKTVFEAVTKASKARTDVSNIYILFNYYLNI